MSLARTRLSSPRRDSRSGRRVHRQPCPLVLSSSRPLRAHASLHAHFAPRGPGPQGLAPPIEPFRVSRLPSTPGRCSHGLVRSTGARTSLRPPRGGASRRHDGIAAATDGHLRDDAQLPREGFERGLASGTLPPANRGLGTGVRGPGASSGLADCVAGNGRTSKTVREERLLGPDFRVAPASCGT